MRRPSERHRLFARLYFLQRVYEPLGMWRHRRAVCGKAEGRTLEIGVGSGFSLPYYRIDSLVACDPNATMVRLARKQARKRSMRVSFVVASAEALPFAPGTFDTVTSCLTFCTIGNRETAAGEVERVLRTDGVFRFVDHGLSSRPRYAKLQRAITPMWMHFNGGCHLDRDAAPPVASMRLDKLTRCSGGTVARGTATKIAEQEEAHA